MADEPNVNTSLALIPTPDRIANNLASIEDMLEGDLMDEQNVKMVKRMLRQAASNVRLLFELSADDTTGEFRLQNYGQAWMLADLLKNGKMVPSSYDNDEQVVIALMKGMEIGIPPISALGNIMIINNRPSVWGDLAQALVERTHLITDHSKEEIGTIPTPGTELNNFSPDYGYRVTFTRKGVATPYEGKFTVANAKRSGLWMNTSKKPWIQSPERMLFNRARAFALRDGFSDCLFGMGIVEEQRDFEAVEPALLAGPSAEDEPVTAEMLEHHREPEMASYENRSAPAPVEAKSGEERLV